MSGISPSTLWDGSKSERAASAAKTYKVGNAVYYPDVEQLSEQWFELRCGILTASTMKAIITPAKLKRASHAKASAHLYELVAQRIAGYTDASDYLSDDMERGYADEYQARELYGKHYAPVETRGFITNSKWGFTIGYSPDGLVGDDGLLECKSRRHKYQVETILANAMPSEFLMQVQAGLLVSERAWCDFISYSAGLPMTVIRVYADEAVQSAIVEAATSIESEITDALALYERRIAATKHIHTERRQPEAEITA